ncbi:elongator complex protein 6-like isoform X2 [Antedon mediterranea]|uniref:elongator complex protein 6-like isoform X2 n=1 Tax=Antedon mediterranea TaxID=105859 RepID=UPI003AF8782E
MLKEEVRCACCVCHKHLVTIVQLHTSLDDGQVTVIDGLQLSQETIQPANQNSETSPLACIRNSKLDLQSLLVHITTRLSKSGCDNSPVTLIIDDVSVLISLGLSVNTVLDFIQYCQVWFCGKNGCVVLLVHDDKDTLDESNQQLHTLMLHRSTHSIECHPLPTGYSKDVHGQINIMRRELDDGRPNRNASRQFHYKITDKTMRLFAVGTSSAVL